jgi:broad specificity phosphatase PhoE
MKIYVLRHEDRPMNNPGFLTELTDIGKHKAIFSLKNTLKNISFTHIFSSPFLRVLQTIAPYVENNHYVNIEYGLAEGLQDPVFEDEIDFTVTNSPCHLGSYESVVDINNYKYYEDEEIIRTRVKVFYDSLVMNYKNDNHIILLACHQCICNILLELMTKIPRGQDEEYNMGKLTTINEDNEIICIN